jgi:hypothetical protein
MRASAFLLIGLALVGLSCTPQPPPNPTGIEVLGVQLMAGGDIARLNYRVVDYTTAKQALQAEVHLFKEGTDRPLGILSTGRLGPLRQRPTKDGRPQFMIFMNDARSLRKGDRAVLTVGKTRIAGITVS